MEVGGPGSVSAEPNPGPNGLMYKLHLMLERGKGRGTSPDASWGRWRLQRRGCFLVGLGCCNKHHRPGGSNNRHLFLPVLEARRQRPGPVLAGFSEPLPGCGAPSCGVLTRRGRGALLATAPSKGTSPIAGLHLVTSSTSTYLPEAPSPNTFPLGSGRPHVHSRGRRHSVHSRGADHRLCP